jgi:hypothetical protein
LNTEPFATPDGPEDIILECDGCRNLLYVKANDQVDEVADCPICGCLNKVTLEEPQQIRGRLLLKSPEMSMNRDSVEQGRVALPGLPEKVQEALIWLQENKWTFGFIVEEDEKKSKDSDPKDEGS